MKGSFQAHGPQEDKSWAEFTGLEEVALLWIAIIQGLQELHDVVWRKEKEIPPRCSGFEGDS